MQKNCADFIKLKKTNKKCLHKLTIFLVTYNHEKTIRDTLKSIVKQKTQHNFIVKILDDCSTDDTVKICKEYANKYPNLFKLIAQKHNTNMQHIKQAMVSELKTPYWCFIEGDDYYTDSSFIDTAINFFETHPDYNMFAAKHKLKTLDNEFSDTFAKQNFIPNKDLSMVNFVYCQTSARIYRNIFDFVKMQNYPYIYDIYLFFLYLYVGKTYFYNHFVSVYRQNLNGSWTKLDDKHQKRESRIVVWNLIKYFGYEPRQTLIRMYPKRTMKRLNKVLGSWITIRIIKAYEFIFSKKS